MGVCVGLGAVQVGEVRQGQTLRGGNAREGKLEARGTHSPAASLQLAGKDSVGMARTARPCPGRCGGSTDSELRCGNWNFP